MKKITLALLLLTSWGYLMANPIPVPSVEINEVMFDEDGEWLLEILCYSDTECSVNSIYVSSSSGRVASRFIPIFSNNHVDMMLFVLTQDSLVSSLSINPLGDSISIEMDFEIPEYEKDYSYTSTLVFGNYPGAKIHAPKEGQSIVYVSEVRYLYNLYHYIKTNQPSIGEPNSGDIYGALRGNLYDKNGNPVDKKKFTLIDIYYYSPVDIENGEYSIRLLAQPFSSNAVYISDSWIPIEPITVYMEPGETTEQDIYLLADIPVSIDAPTDAATGFPIRIYPNPLVSGREVHYEIALPVKSMNMEVEVFAMNGALVYQGQITDASGTISLPGNLAVGTYVMNFRMNNQRAYSTRIVIQ